jgi:hypothetical protein
MNRVKNTIPVRVYNERRLCVGLQNITSEEFAMTYHCTEFPARLLFDSDQCRQMNIGLSERITISKAVTFV